MRFFKVLAAVLAGAALVACGGGGKSGSTTTSTTSAAATIELLSSLNAVGTGQDQVTITAVVKDANNISLAAAPVAFSTDTGTLSGASSVTDAAGVAKATFSAGADKSNRTATIKVTSGSATGTLVLPIAGTKLSYSGVTTLALGAKSTVTITAIDAKGSPISGATINVASSLGNTLGAASGTTDANGQFSVDYTATNSGTDQLTFSGLGTELKASMSISGEDFSFTMPAASTSVVVGTAQTVKVTYRKNGAGQAGVVVSFAATIGTLSATTATTDANGVATVSVSSSFAGSSTLTASATVSSGNVQATLPLQFIATTPSKVVLQVSPSSIPPNPLGSTNNQSTATAKVTDINGNPVTGVTVNFSQDADLSGGSLQQASAVTDTSGTAIVKYIAGPNSTSSGGVVLRAAVAGSPAIFGTASLTVNAASLYIAIGTGNKLLLPDQQTYQQNWLVYVTDANSVPVSGVTLTLRALPVQYGKGFMTFDATAKQWVPDTSSVQCANEDVNYNGILDAGEDIDGNGRLQPGNVIAVSPGTITTDSTGRATVSLIWARSYSPWVKVYIEARALVSGTESVTTSPNFWVPAVSADISDPNTTPPGFISPFGVHDCVTPN